MNATELAVIVDGWPKEAESPHMQWGPDAFWYDGDPYGEGSRLSTELAIDLATVSGLRWLIAERKQHYCIGVTKGSAAVTSGLFYLDRHLGYGDCDAQFTGPTLLHAIDAAIKATKGSQ